jgi:hypothetical protein
MKMEVAFSYETLITTYKTLGSKRLLILRRGWLSGVLKITINHPEEEIYWSEAG